MRDDTTQGKTRKEGIYDKSHIQSYNCWIMVIIFINVKVSLTISKDKPIIYIYKRLRKIYYIVGFIKEKVKRTQCRDMRANNHVYVQNYICGAQWIEKYITFRYAFKTSIKENDKILICLKNKK